MTGDIQYPDEFIDRLQLVWGKGFLSPGGPDEVRGIVDGLDLTDREVLDIGCGTGGPALVLARDLGARVVSIDIEEPVLARARALAAEEGVTDRIEFRLVEPGPLPFADASFDVIFSKDALIHIPDKAALYRDVLRVLRPGGVFAASDWLSGEGAMDDPVFQRFLELSHLDFAMATAAETEATMRAAGFEAVSSRDRNAWYAGVSAEDLARFEGPLRDEAIALMGTETYAQVVEIRRALTAAARSGSLRPTHLYGTRPRA